jgi:hypothetical protein
MCGHVGVPFRVVVVCGGSRVCGTVVCLCAPNLLCRNCSMWTRAQSQRHTLLLLRTAWQLHRLQCGCSCVVAGCAALWAWGGGRCTKGVFDRVVRSSEDVVVCVCAGCVCESERAAGSLLPAVAFRVVVGAASRQGLGGPAVASCGRQFSKCLDVGEACPGRERLVFQPRRQVPAELQIGACLVVLYFLPPGRSWVRSPAPNLCALAAWCASCGVLVQLTCRHCTPRGCAVDCGDVSPCSWAKGNLNRFTYSLVSLFL